MKLSLIGQWKLISSNRLANQLTTPFPIGTRIFFNPEGGCEMLGRDGNVSRFDYTYDPENHLLTIRPRLGGPMVFSVLHRKSNPPNLVTFCRFASEDGKYDELEFVPDLSYSQTDHSSLSQRRDLH